MRRGSTICLDKKKKKYGKDAMTDKLDAFSEYFSHQKPVKPFIEVLQFLEQQQQGQLLLKNHYTKADLVDALERKYGDAALTLQVGAKIVKGNTPVIALTDYQFIPLFPIHNMHSTWPIIKNCIAMVSPDKDGSPIIKATLKFWNGTADDPGKVLVSQSLADALKIQDDDLFRIHSASVSTEGLNLDEL